MLAQLDTRPHLTGGSGGWEGSVGFLGMNVHDFGGDERGQLAAKCPSTSEDPGPGLVAVLFPSCLGLCSLPPTRLGLAGLFPWVPQVAAVTGQRRLSPSLWALLS